MKSVVFAVFLIFASPAYGDVIRCNFDAWQGATEDVAISWVGLGFEINTSRNLVRFIDVSGYSDWINAIYEPIGTTAVYKWLSEAESSADVTLVNSYNFVFWDDGRCEAVMSTEGYSPIGGRGRFD